MGNTNTHTQWHCGQLVLLHQMGLPQNATVMTQAALLIQMSPLVTTSTFVQGLYWWQVCSVWRMHHPASFSSSTPAQNSTHRNTRTAKHSTAFSMLLVKNIKRRPAIKISLSLSHTNGSPPSSHQSCLYNYSTTLLYCPFIFCPSIIYMYQYTM